jgi:hypothetical protein
MVMSESLEVQTKVYDRLTEVEAKVVAFRLPQSYAEALLELATTVQKTEVHQGNRERVPQHKFQKKDF